MHSLVLYCIVLYCILLYFIVLYCIVFYCIRTVLYKVTLSSCHTSPLASLFYPTQDRLPNLTRNVSLSTLTLPALSRLRQAAAAEEVRRLEPKSPAQLYEEDLAELRPKLVEFLGKDAVMPVLDY